MAPKRKKKSKKQIQEELERELELKRKQDEEDRKAAEERRIKQEEEKRIRDAYLTKLAEEERVRLDEEEEELKPWRNEIRREMHTYQKENLERFNWEKLVRCEKRPDVYQEKELNTFLSTWREEEEINFAQCLTRCNEAEMVVEDLHAIMAEGAESNDEVKLTYAKKFCTEIREMEVKKINDITAYIMQHADQYIAENIATEQDLQPVMHYDQAVNQRKLAASEFCLNFHSESLKMGIWGHFKPDGLRHKPVGFFELDMTQSLPRTLIGNSNILRALWTNYDFISSEVYSSNRILGGIVDFSLMNFPDLPKKAKGWVCRKFGTQEEALTKILYPSDGSASGTHHLKGSFKLPASIYIPAGEETVRLGWWDNKEEKWSQEGIDSPKFDPDTRIVSFTTVGIAPLACLQDRCTDYPYASWSLRSISPSEGLLNLEGKRLDLKFKIGPGWVELLDRTEPELESFANYRASPGLLLIKLARCGINLMPDNRDSEFDGEISVKEDAAIERALQDIALAIGTFAFRSSKFNRTLPKSRLIVRVRENLEYDESFAEDEEIHWSTAVWEHNRCYLVSDKESAKKCKLEVPGDYTTHSVFKLVMREYEGCTAEAQRRLEEIYSMEYYDTVRKLLRLLKIFSFQ
eukprot:CAMPEP_0115036734 /NCGR_PEP_ID=MMETSP0216-20121206/42310_1 /TAXON_ID=223996 /ORGANISM="Protocruzia adherens, Strain Boccale" /LENGTH=633 /DNA_ID=CAMNT_0002416641 /DNA_START=8 /DNA_END=1909 /DNA_ORIENTATION=-